ncbi:MAG: hypothetical protein U0165_16650 [Polyangiaceae bacterium]
MSFAESIRSYSVLFVALFSCGCDKIHGKEITLPVYARPSLLKAERSCDELAKTTPGARWTDSLSLTIAHGGQLLIGDPAVLGGPFQTPLTLDAIEGELKVRVLIGPSTQRTSPLCVQIRATEGEASSWSAQGEVTIDSELLALAQGPAYLGWAQKSVELTVTSIDGASSDLDRLTPALESAGFKTDRVLPTLLRGARPAERGDAALVLNTAKQVGVQVKTSPEPASPVWEFLRALGESSIAVVKLDEKQTALVIEAPSNEATYPVFVGRRSDGATALAEVRFAP